MIGMRYCLLPLAVMSLSSCATLYRATISEIRPVKSAAEEVDIKASEMGFDVKGAASLTRGLANRYGNKNAKSAGGILDFAVAMSSWAPATGNPTLREDWSDAVATELRQRCQGGRVENLTVLREAASYPLVSGEIVRVKAYCAR